MDGLGSDACVRSTHAMAYARPIQQPKYNFKLFGAVC